VCLSHRTCTNVHSHVIILQTHSDVIHHFKMRKQPLYHQYQYLSSTVHWPVSPVQVNRTRFVGRWWSARLSTATNHWLVVFHVGRHTLLMTVFITFISSEMSGCEATQLAMAVTNQNRLVGGKHVFAILHHWLLPALHNLTAFWLVAATANWLISQPLTVIINIH